MVPLSTSTTVTNQTIERNRQPKSCTRAKRTSQEGGKKFSGYDSEYEIMDGYRWSTNTGEDVGGKVTRGARDSGNSEGCCSQEGMGHLSQRWGEGISGGWCEAVAGGIIRFTELKIGSQ